MVKQPLMLLRYDDHLFILVHKLHILGVKKNPFFLQ